MQDTKEEAEEVSTSIQPGAAALERIATLFKMVKEGIASVKRVANAFAKSLKKVFSWADLSKDFGAFIKIVAELGTAIEINDERAEKLEGIFSGLLSVVDLIRQAFWFVASILSATLSPVLSVIIDLFLWLGDKVGRAVTKFNEFIKKGDYLNRILTKIRNVISKVTDWLGLFFEKFKELPAVQKITDALGDFTDECKDGILKYVDQAADKLEELFGVAEDADTSAMDTTLGTINTALENMLKFSTDVKEMLTKVYEKFDSIASPIANVSQTFSNLKTNMAKTKLISGDLLKSNGFIGVMSTLAGYFDGVRDKINSFVSFILDKVKSFDYAKAALIGFAASVMTLLTSLSYFFFTFSNVAIAIETMTYSISGAFKALAKRIYDPLNGKAKIIRAVALALLALAASLFLISKIPEDRLTSCVVALGAMIVLMGTFTVGLVLLTKNLTAVEHANLTKTLAEVATVMMMLAASVLVLSLALNIISLVPYENLWRNLGILSLLLYEMVAAAVVLSTATPQVTKGGMSLLFLAGGVYILVASLQKLTELEIEGIQEKLLIVIGCLVTIGIVAFLASKTGIGSTVGVLAIVASIWLIELALIDIMAYGVTMEEVLLHLNQFIPVLLLLGIISGIMIAMGATGAKASGVAGVIIASAVAMLAIMFAIKALTDVYKENGSEAYAMACMGIIALFGMIIIMIRVLQKSAVGARNAGKALVSISLALAMMAIILYLLGQVNDIEVIIQGIGAIAALSVLATMLMAVSQYTERANPKSIAAMIGMIASMALIIALLSLIPDKAAMWESVAIFSLGLIELAISMYVLCNQAKKINEKKLLLMILMISTVALSILAIMKYNSDYGKAVSCAIALGIAIVAVAGAMAIMNKTWPSNLSKRRLAELAIMIGMVAVVGASLMGIAALGQNWGSVLAAGYAMTAVMIAMAYSMQIVNNSWPKKMKKTRLAELAIMIGMVAVIGAALIGLASLGDNWGSILASAVAMAIVMASVGAMMTIINSNFPKGLSKGDMASLAIIIGLVAVIGASLMGIASLGKSWASILAAALAMSASLMAFAGALTIMANIHILPSDAAAFALAAIALVPIASALAVLSQFNWAELGRSLILMLASMAILTSVMVVLAALEYALPGSVTLVLASLVPTLYAMAAVLLSLALSIMAFSKCIPALTKGLKDLTKIEYAKIKLEIIFGLIGAVALLGVGMVVFAFGLTKVAMALAVAGAGLAVFSVGLNTLVIPVLILTANLYRIVEAIGALGASGERYAKGLDALARSLKTNFSTILTSIVQGLIDALVLLASNQPKIISCLVTISTTLLALIYSWINKVVGIVVVGIVLISAKIAEKAPIITKNILKIIDTFLDAVVQYAGKLAKYAMMLVFAFVEGALTALELMFPSFLERIVSLVLTVIESIAQVLYNNEDRLCNAIRAVVDVVALTLMKILNEMFGGALENFDWYSGVEEELSASVQRTAAKQGELAAKTTSSSYSTQMSKEKAGMSDATSDAIGGAFDDTNDLVGRKAKITAGYSVDSLKEGVKSKIGDFKDYIQGEITDGFSINGDEIEHVAGETVEKATTYDSGRTKHIIETNISGATDIAIDNLKKQGWKFSDTAEDIMYKEYWTGVAGSDADEKTQSAFNSNVDSLTKNSTLSSILYGNGQYGTGQYYSGMLNIDSNKYVDELSKQSTDVVENGLVTPTEDALGIDSPSKVAAEISQYYLKGLVVGVKDNLGLVDETFTDLGNTISEDTKSSLYAFSDLLGDDKEWTPTITPVVDTTNIENARTLMNETFDDTSFKMAANANVTVGESSQSNLANQISNLSDKVDKLANKEYVNNFVVNADTTVDGTTLRKTSAAYTIKAVDDNQRAYIMSRGGRA